jgi:predicted GIY-YIG superfamily endonuclease
VTKNAYTYIMSNKKRSTFEIGITAEILKRVQDDRSGENN